MSTNGADKIRRKPVVSQVDLVDGAGNDETTSYLLSSLHTATDNEAQYAHLRPTSHEFPKENYSTDFTPITPHRQPVISSDLQISLEKTFNSRIQFWQILWKGFIIWIRTVALLVLLGVILVVYNQKPVMSSGEANTFNALVTALSITLGLNIAMALKEMTLNMRWYFLSRTVRPLSEVNTIIKSGVSSLASYRLNPRPWTGMTALSWILLNIGAQVGIACLSFTWSVGSDTSNLLFSDGHINITDFSSFYPSTTSTVSSNDTREQDDRWAANNYGNVALLTSPFGNYSDMPAPGDAYGSTDSKIWIQYGDKAWWSYRFLATSSNETFKAGFPPIASAYTDRSINVTWSCQSFMVDPSTGNGTINNITYVDNPSTGHTSHYMVPVVQQAQTSFWTGTASEGAPRSAQVYAFEPDNTAPWFYNCNITVSEVANATLDVHKISDDTAFYAAQAIALGGQDESSGDPNHPHRTQRYPQQSWGYGARWLGNAGNMGHNIAHFSIGAISVADKFNPRITIPGQQPKAGVSLTISSAKYLIIIFLLVGGLQFLMLLVTSYVANKVIVTDDSPVAVARLLAPVMARLGNSGTIASGKEICDVLERDDQMRVRYTVHHNESDRTRKRLVLSDELREPIMENGRYL